MICIVILNKKTENKHIENNKHVEDGLIELNFCNDETNYVQYIDLTGCKSGPKVTTMKRKLMESQEDDSEVVNAKSKKRKIMSNTNHQL